jgi:hypothetical protein
MKKVSVIFFSVLLIVLFSVSVDCKRGEKTAEVPKPAEVQASTPQAPTPERLAKASAHAPLSIITPQDGSRVCWRTIVKGTISDPKFQVFVAIHPMATDKFWIQPVPTVSSEGIWTAYCYFGEPNIGIGEPFEIIAIASKNKKLFKEGDTMPAPLPESPEILIRSDPVMVIRDKCFK